VTKNDVIKLFLALELFQ